ncbi:cytochrome c oxidase subunit II [soil metagenome]
MTAGLHAQTSIPDSDKPYRRIANMFDPLSKPAEMIHESAFLVSMICLGIFLVVTGILVYVVVKFRYKKTDDDREPPQIYGSTNIELAWTVIPIIITVVLILVTSRTIGEIQDRPMPKDALKVTIVGHQWWWEIRYPDLGIVTANELHIPVSGRKGEFAGPTHLLLQSADVIHSFWVPQLSGKVDVIPNKDNDMWFEPYETGVYFGNCAEYCGTQHANMMIRVIVHSPEDFERWKAEQKLALVAPTSGVAKEGHDMFFNNSCVNCHTIDGTVAKGLFGPNLTKLMMRQTIGAGVAPLTEANLHDWVKDPQHLKAGCLMPNMLLLDKEVTAITAYLQTLK